MNLFIYLMLDVIMTRNSASIHASPDFTNDEDFIQRMEHYQKSYETVLDTEGSYIKVVCLFFFNFSNIIY